MVDLPNPLIHNYTSHFPPPGHADHVGPPELVLVEAVSGQHVVGEGVGARGAVGALRGVWE